MARPNWKDKQVTTASFCCVHQITHVSMLVQGSYITLLKKMLIPASAQVSPPPVGLGRVGLNAKFYYFRVKSHQDLNREIKNMSDN